MKTMFLRTDYGGYVLTLAAMLSMTFWEELHHVGVMIVVLSGLVGLSLGVARTIDFINTRYDGDVKKYFKNAFKLKSKPSEKRK